MKSDNKKLGIIQNNDINNILCGNYKNGMNAGTYREMVNHLLEGKPDILAQNVGFPDSVLYRSSVANLFSKYCVEVSRMVWGEEGIEEAIKEVETLEGIVMSGTDPFQITIEECRKKGVSVFASYRMNTEDFYDHTYQLSDFGRNHPEWLIPGSGALDYAVPEVYGYRMNIFREVAQDFDIDGIEFDFRRWYRMISDPLKNHYILTRLVRDTRKMLDETAAAKGKDELKLGVRVGVDIEGSYSIDEFPGALNQVCDVLTCRELGLDVGTWINEELVDYVCPSLFYPRLPGIPRIKRFVELAANKNVGIYPTVFPYTRWLPSENIPLENTPPDLISTLMKDIRNQICDAAMQCFADKADGISTYNWFGHLQYAQDAEGMHPQLKTLRYKAPELKTELMVHSHLGSVEALKECMKKNPDIKVEYDWK